MKWIDVTFPTPAENLACDEALLNMLEEGGEGEILRFWESPQYFVVLGSSNKVREEVHAELCTADGIPVLRRHSGGGCVLQGPGCLNYSLLLRIDADRPTRSVTETTRFILQRHAEAMTELLGNRVEINGSSDLTIGDRKFSGNAQRRRLRALLFHGTFLLDFDVGLMEKYLKPPPKQPDYRRRRTHRDFVRNIPVSASTTKRKLVQVWEAEGQCDALPVATIEHLAHTKYSSEAWNLRM